MPFAAIWMNLEIVMLSEIVREISYHVAYMCSKKERYLQSYLQNRNRLTDLEN